MGDWDLARSPGARPFAEAAESIARCVCVREGVRMRALHDASQGLAIVKRGNGLGQSIQDVQVRDGCGGCDGNDDACGRIKLR